MIKGVLFKQLGCMLCFADGQGGVGRHNGLSKSLMYRISVVIKFFHPES